ncbi:hypothetical protein D3C81_2151850 [compost metagenome]
MAEADFGVQTSTEQVMRLMVPFMAAGMRADSALSDEMLDARPCLQGRVGVVE